MNELLEKLTRLGKTYQVKSIRNFKKLLSQPVWIGSVVMLLTLMFSFIASSYVFYLIQDSVKEDLNSTLESSINKVLREGKSLSRTTSYWAETHELRQLAQSLVSSTTSAITPELLRTVHSDLNAVVDTEQFIGYHIIDTEGVVLMSSYLNTQSKDQLIQLSSRELNAVKSGQKIVTPPTHTNVLGPSSSDKSPTIFSLAPIRDWYGDVIAVFAFEVETAAIYANAFLEGQIGETGQSYGYDMHGHILTPLKYTFTSDSVIKVGREIIDQLEGVRLDGFTNYRGTTVIGAWKWVDELNLGVITETETSEVYKVYRSILYGVLFSVLMVGILVALAGYYYRRINSERLETLKQRDAIINQTDEGFVTINKFGIIKQINPAITNLYGYTEEELIGSPSSKLLSTAELNPIESDHIPPSQYFFSQRADGSEFPIELNITPIQFGHKHYFIANIRDISDTHRYQQDIIEAMKSAEHANQAKSEFLAKMSHELRTPLNAIIGFSDILLQERLDDEQKESVELINSSGNHLLQLINDVLDLSKIESGKVSISMEKIDIKPLIEELVSLIQVQLATHSITLNTHYSNKLTSTYVEADYLKLKQVLLNLLTNAIKYNRPKGKVDITISQSENAFTRIAIRDTGLGIDEAYQQDLFKPFNRLDKEKTTIQGTGIGLVISHELTEMMGGKLGFTSQREEGSTFWVELKSTTHLASGSILSPDLFRESDNKAASSAYAYLLYIEDDKTNLQLMTQFMQRHASYKLFTAKTAQQGLEMATEFEPDIILLDMNLPDMHGIDVIKQLRQSAVTQDIKIIVISANVVRHDIETAYQTGCDRYLTKPINFTELKQAIDEIITHAG